MSLFCSEFPVCHCVDCENYVKTLGVKSDTPLKEVVCLTFKHLKELYENNAPDFTLILRDFDGYDYVKQNMNLTQVLNNPTRKMGHAFVLAMLLTQDAALKQCAIR